MGDRITERLQFIVGTLQLRCSFSDTLLQFRIEITYWGCKVNRVSAKDK